VSPILGRPALVVLVTTAFAAVSAAVWGDDPAGGGASSSSSGGSSSGGSSSGGSSSGGSSSGGAPGPGTTHAGCTIFPGDNPWNQDISGAPVDQALMATVMPGMSLSRGLHPDWGTSAEGYGFPIAVGEASAPVPITFSSKYGPKESDKLPCAGGGGDFCYPVPTDAKIEGGGDRHLLFLATDGAPGKCVLYELFDTARSGGGFSCASAAIFHLDSNALRPDGWTSADAAGLPILPGLVKKDEIDEGEITHAIRFTMDRTRNAYIHPATHAAGAADEARPPMGLRLRLKASFDESKLTGAPLVVAKALKKYGLILADNGSDWFLSGEQSDSWDMDPLVEQLRTIKGADFEIVSTGTIVPVAD
jgi:hypothetical protein